MFDADCKRLNQISDFTKAGIIAKTITVTPTGSRTEDMKLRHIDFEEWADKDLDFKILMYIRISVNIVFFVPFSVNTTIQIPLRQPLKGSNVLRLMMSL